MPWDSFFLRKKNYYPSTFDSEVYIFYSLRYCSYYKKLLKNHIIVYIRHSNWFSASIYHFDTYVWMYTEFYKYSLGELIVLFKSKGCTSFYDHAGHSFRPIDWQINIISVMKYKLKIQCTVFFWNFRKRKYKWI